MTRVYFCLSLLAASGVALLSLPESYMKLRAAEPFGALRLWQVSLESFAVPLSLLALSFTRHLVVRIFTLLWGLWIVGITLWLLWRIPEELPQINFHGMLFLFFALIVGSSTAMFTAMSFYIPHTPRPEPPPPPQKTESSGSSERKTFDHPPISPQG
jgi:lysylphosphatidylglycerol synthetase-like protein (DUF2156 family)